MSSKSDFDFLIGSWTIDNRMLKEPLCGSDKWRKFEASMDTIKILGGAGNRSIFRAIINSRYLEAIIMRLFNPATKHWSLNWVDNWSVVFKPSLEGEFINGTGKFFCDDIWKGKLIRVRYVWEKIMPNSANLERAFSEDGEKTWETNWIMELRKNG